MLEIGTIFQIAKRDLKNFFYKFILLAYAVSIILEIWGTTMELSWEQHIVLVGNYGGAIGIILFSGIFFRENNSALRELINSKWVNLKSIYFVRYIFSCFALLFIFFSWVIIYIISNNLNGVLLYFVHSFSVSFLFGSLTFALYVPKNNTIITYMISFFLFILYVENESIPFIYIKIKNCIFILCGILLTCFSFDWMKHSCER